MKLDTNQTYAVTVLNSDKSWFTQYFITNENEWWWFDVELIFSRTLLKAKFEDVRTVPAKSIGGHEREHNLFVLEGPPEKVTKLPCPFCGSKELKDDNKLTSHGTYHVYTTASNFVKCEECDAVGPDVLARKLFDSAAKRHARIKWNSRG